MIHHPFNDREGLRIAIELERRGLNFYEHALKVTKSAEVRALLLELADDERGHIAEFSRLYENMAEPSPEENYDDETSAYLSAIAADVVFPGGLSALAKDSGLESTKSILDCGIQSEKDAILFYNALIERIGNEAHRNAFVEIVLREMAHLSRLKSLLMEETGV